MEALAKIRISGEQRQVLDVIIRKTYGYNKKEDWISISQFVLATGLPKSSICRAINKLLTKNIIYKKVNAIDKKVNDIPLSYSFCKDFDKWKPLPKKITIYKNVNPHLQKCKSSFTKMRHTKESTTKDTVTKDYALTNLTTKKQDKDKYNTEEFFNKVWSRYPRRLGRKEALRHYQATVKVEQDFLDINKALDNYLTTDNVVNKTKYILHGATWFNNWKDWVEYKDKAGRQEVEDEIVPYGYRTLD